MQGDRLAGGWQGHQGGHGGLEFVADPGHVHHQPGWLLLEQGAAQASDHGKSVSFTAGKGAAGPSKWPLTRATILVVRAADQPWQKDRKSTRLNSSHVRISY